MAKKRKLSSRRNRLKNIGGSDENSTAEDIEVLNADIDDMLEHAGDELQLVAGGPQIIKRYPKQKCVVEDCIRYAVGADDVCKKHGGDPVIRGNLMPSEDMTITQIGQKYDRTEHPLLFIELAQQGYSEVEIAAEIGVSVHTLRGWAEKFTEFNACYEAGQALHEAWWLKQGKENLDNRGYNVGLFKFLTGNKLGYSDKMETKNLHVHAGVLQVPATISEDDWEKKHAKTS